MAFFFYTSPADAAMRAKLQADVDIAASNLREAKRRYRAATQTLERFNRGERIEDASLDEPSIAKGRTQLVKRAIIFQEGRPFSPRVLLATIREIFPAESHLCPDPNAITRVLLKLTSAGYVERLSSGAGLKEPIYRATQIRNSSIETKT